MKPPGMWDRPNPPPSIEEQTEASALATGDLVGIAQPGHSRPIGQRVVPFLLRGFASCNLGGQPRSRRFDLAGSSREPPGPNLQKTGSRKQGQSRPFLPGWQRDKKSTLIPVSKLLG